MREAIEFFGVATFFLLCATFILGLILWKKRSLLSFKFHLLFAILTVISATTHLVLINIR